MQTLISFFALFTGITAALITYLFSVNKEHIFLVRQKYEALYIAISKFEISVKMRYELNFDLIADKITYAEFSELKSKQPIENYAYEEANMLVNIYFHDLLEEWGKYEDRRKTLAAFAGATVRDKKVGNKHNKLEHIKTMNKIWEDFTGASKDMKAAILAAAREKSAIDVLRPNFFSKIHQRAKINLSRSMDG